MVSFELFPKNNFGKMVKHTQTIRRLLPRNCLSVFDHFVGLALKGLRKNTFPESYRKSNDDRGTS